MIRQKHLDHLTKDRMDLLWGEGAGVLIIEDYEYAKARGANIICEFAGFVHRVMHFISPAPEGEGGARAMQQALQTWG